MRKIFLSAVAITLLATACKKDNLSENNINSTSSTEASNSGENTNSSTSSNSSTSDDNAELVSQLKSYAPVEQNQTKNSDEVITFTTEKGNEIIFPARAFVDGSGNPVTGNIDVSVTEITKVSEMILSGMMTNSDQGPLSSQGEFNIEVSKNGQPLELAEGSTFTIENKNAEADKDMKGWVWKENKTVGEAFENNVGEWIRNEFDENNPCKRMQSLWAAFESNTSAEHSSLWQDIKPLKDLVFTEINKIIPLNDKIGNAVIFDYELEWNQQKSIIFSNSNDFWEIQDYIDSTSIYFGETFLFGNGAVQGEHNYFDTFTDQYYEIDINACQLWQRFDDAWQSYSFDPNVINITFSQLSWCNIDRLLSEYGQINSCKLKGSFPDHAQVKIIFKDLNGALSCDFSNDGFVAKRLPEGYELMFLVYFKDGDSIKFGTQTITASEEMTFNEENLKTLTDMDALVEEIEKIVD
jgi:hypothetical protein